MTKTVYALLLLFVGLLAFLVYFRWPTKKKHVKPGDPWELAKSYEVRGLDLSHWNGRVLYDDLDTLDFVFLKVSEGDDRVDDTFEQHYEAFRERDIPVGAYHFFRFDVDGKEQAQHFLKHLDGRRLQLPLVIDVEQHGNRAIPHEKVKKRLHAFMKELKRHTKHQPIFYTNGDGYRDFIEDEFGNHTLWLSSTNTWRPTMMDCTFWQFNIDADLMAITHRADLNVFRGSREEWEEYLEEHKPYVISMN
ncbi:glycoside hydrolase family 25 protein [Aquirufa regiilacus]|uniref:GH25 family lysozyme n=1 Tax=Aquirufa regiilacus TaxID=3024868 RepID=A0ABU3TNP7_9BACT|nr:GH25 family lysozyme [Aquirufa sp. LEOWEIH-7C]MDU0807476.1 GH25 family lysozyme [Aquirufa sp. LEOWEIH-7C]